MATTNEASNGEPLLAAPDTPRSEAPHHEHHYSQRSPWVRAAVLGACDGVVTVGALITGIASAQGNQKQLLLSACAGMMSGTFLKMCMFPVWRSFVSHGALSHAHSVFSIYQYVHTPLRVSLVLTHCEHKFSM